MQTETKSNGQNEKLTILKYPDLRLKEVSVDCIESDLDFIKESAPKMIEAMRDGIGLAAIQVGIAKRFCILKDKSTNHIIINPVITKQEDPVRVKEGCLSLPYFYEFIDRFDKITVTYRDEQWIERTAELEGLEAQCMLHELDHFDGKLQLDKVSLMVQGMWKKKAKKKGIL